MNTPVALIIFKRPSTTERVFEAIRQAKPSKLFVIADGARLDRPGEVEKCEATRAIIEQVDWDCEVLKYYSDINRGVKWNVVDGLNWVFNNVDEAIILEDDCLPHPTFFRYCEELLNYYRNDKRVMTISGNNFQFGQKRTDYSYYFSRYPNTWGWATWKRAWQSFDIEMKLWEKIRDNNYLELIFEEPKLASYWSYVFQSAYDDKIIAWDYQWIFNSWVNSGLCIIPNVNLVSNIGYGEEATNTKDVISPYSNIPFREMHFPISHSPFVFRHAEADRFIQNTHYYQTNQFIRTMDKAKKILGKMQSLVSWQKIFRYQT
jgi:hypothetical protein